MNYYEHHLGDYAAATAHLSWDEDMAYTRLLRAYYHHEKGIPQGQEYRLARASTPAQRKAVDSVLAEFFSLVDGAHTQKRADEEIARYRDKQSKASASAAERWRRARAQSEGNANAPPDAMRTHSEGNAPRHQTPDTTTAPKVRSGRGSRLPPDWDPGETGLVFATNHGLTNGRVVAELAKFRDHWAAKTGQEATKADWQAAWRNWVRKSVEFAPHGAGRKSEQLMAGNIAAAQEFLASTGDA